MKTYSIAVLPGDGIGPEVTAQAVLALSAAAGKYGFCLKFSEHPVGGAAIDRSGDPLPDSTLRACRASDAVLLGAVGGPKWDGGAARPESGLLAVRRGMGLFTNLRPAKLWPALAKICPLRDSGWDDILIVRELTGGLYFGERGRESAGGDVRAYDTMAYTGAEIDRVLRAAFERALTRRKALVSVDKANVLESSRLWRERASALAALYPGVALTHMYVDNAAMQLVLNPGRFDVIVTENMFGDILSDEAGAITGSIGLLPSASVGKPGTPGLFEPVHGSAPELAGKDLANPVASVLSAAMLLREGLGLTEPAEAIVRAVGAALDGGYRTADIACGGEPVGTREMGRIIASLV